MACLGTCNNSGSHVCSSFSPSTLNLSSFQRLCVWPALGSKSVNVMAFSKDYNATTAHKPSYVIPVEITLSHSSSSKVLVAVHQSVRFNRTKITAVGSSERSGSAATVEEEDEEEPCVKFAFVSSVLLPDGTPDVHLRKACGGQKLRDIMLDANVELYGPYARPLLNCGGGGTCATCLVEVVEGKELLNPRTDKENENLKRHPKNWRLACQAIVGKPDSRGMMVIQQLPEWKAHEWNYRGLPPIEAEEELISSSSD